MNSIENQKICSQENIILNKYRDKVRISQEKLHKLYYIDELSITQIANKLKLGRTTISRYLDKYNIKTRTLEEGLKLILKKYGKFGRYLEKKLNKIQRQLILGTLLGDGTLILGKRNKNPRLKIEHSAKDIEYTKFKRKILANFVTSKINKYTRRNKKMNKIYHSYYFNTPTHPEFAKFYEMFYKDRRKVITKNVLEQLSPFGLAIWIMDDGYYNKKGKFIDIYTMNFTDKENQIIIEWFNEKFDIKPKINFHKQCGKVYLRFNQKDSERLVKIIKPYVIKSMKRKII